MFGVLGEDQSDGSVLQCLIRRIGKDTSIRVKPKGYGSKGGVLTKGHRDIKGLLDLGWKFFVVCLDADGPDDTQTMADIRDKVIMPSGVENDACCVVPIQELEAWILADIAAVTQVFTSWVNPKEITNPEKIDSPKEYLEGQSKGANNKPRYSHATHNEKVAAHLNLDVVYRKCPSFRVFDIFVRKKLGIPTRADERAELERERREAERRKNELKASSNDHPPVA